MVNSSSKVALITGATRGFGFATAIALAKNGTDIIAVGRTSGALEELDDAVRNIGGNATLVPLDITDDTGLQKMSYSIHERWGGLDLWVHSAMHATPLAPVGHISEKDMDTSISVNLRATTRLIAMMDPLLKAKTGCAIYLNDPRAGEKFFGIYGAVKAAQQSLFDSWAAESQTTGPKVLSFTPNPMPTATRARFFPGEDKTSLSGCIDEANRFIQWFDKQETLK